MTDLSDVNMEGVKPMSDAQELGIGQYLVRIEDSEKVATKEKFDEEGNKMPPNHRLVFDMKVYGGPDDGAVEKVGLNLWHVNPDAVRMAKSELKSIQEATGVASANSDHYHGKWLVLEKRAGKTEATKAKLYRHYNAAPASVLDSFKDVPPVPAKTPAPTPAPTATHAAPAQAAPAQSAGDSLPSWAKKKA